MGHHMGMKLIHGSCVSIDGQGVLLLGPSGSGKSDLCLRLVDDGAVLVGDDHLELEIREGCVFASAPLKLAGMLEIRGVGILRDIAFSREAQIKLVVSLVPHEDVERLPPPGAYPLLEVPLVHVKLNAFASSTCAKIRAILKHEALAQDQLL